jgi:hypothetical protein
VLELDHRHVTLEDINYEELAAVTLCHTEYHLFPSAHTPVSWPEQSFDRYSELLSSDRYLEGKARFKCSVLAGKVLLQWSENYRVIGCM